MSKVFIEESTLTAIGDAIREKNGTTSPITPLQMPDRITNLPTGGGGEDLVPATIELVGDLRHFFDATKTICSNLYWMLNYQKRFVTSNITSASYMCRGMGDTASYYWQIPTGLKGLNFTLNFRGQGTSTYSSGCECDHIFDGYKLERIPEFGGGLITNIANFMQNASPVKEIPASWLNKDNFSTFYNSNFAFSRCMGLRRFPKEFIGNIQNSGWAHLQTFYQCSNMDDFLNFPIPKAADGTTYSNVSSNGFSQTFYRCGRASDLTFEMNGSEPYVVSWRSQTIDLKDNFGYMDSVRDIQYAGISTDKEVKDEASYQALKNDPDWYTGNIAYSRYNHDSAVRTINSLPDASAYLASIGNGTNTITFKGEAGSLTDGGAINTLTEAEIAVAAAKGWTVTLV